MLSSTPITPTRIHVRITNEGQTKGQERAQARKAPPRFHALQTKTQAHMPAYTTKRETMSMSARHTSAHAPTDTTKPLMSQTPPSSAKAIPRTVPPPHPSLNPPPSRMSPDSNPSSPPFSLFRPPSLATPDQLPPPFPVCLQTHTWDVHTQCV